MTLAKELRLNIDQKQIKATFDQKTNNGSYTLISHNDGLFELETEMTPGKLERVKLLLKEDKITLQSSKGSLPLVRVK